MGLFLFLAWDWRCARDHEYLIPESLFSSSPVLLARSSTMIFSFFVSAAFEDLFSLWYAPISMDGRVTIALELRWSIEWFEAPLDFFVSVGVGGAKDDTSTDSKHRYLDSAWDQSRYSNLVIV